MTTKIFKLVTGENVIAEVVERWENGRDGTYTIDKPFAIIVTKEGIGLMPFDMFGKAQPIVIKEYHIMFAAEPDPEILAAYKSQTGGIVTPDLGIQTGGL